MAENKTKETDADVDAFLAGVDHTKRQEDAIAMKAIMERLTGYTAKMWGASIVGFGSYDYVYESGHGGTFMLTGFSPRKTALTVYIMPGFSRAAELMAKLGKFKTGKSCLYINKLEDIDLTVLEELITDSVAFMKEKYGVVD
jgi:hypothetical protein